MEKFSFQRSQIGAKRKITKQDKTLYEIEIIDIYKAQDKVKVTTKDMLQNSRSGGRAMSLDANLFPEVAFSLRLSLDLLVEAV